MVGQLVIGSEKPQSNSGTLSIWLTGCGFFIQAITRSKDTTNTSSNVPSHSRKLEGVIKVVMMRANYMMDKVLQMM